MEGKKKWLLRASEVHFLIEMFSLWIFKNDLKKDQRESKNRIYRSLLFLPSLQRNLDRPRQILSADLVPCPREDQRDQWCLWHTPGIQTISLDGVIIRTSAELKVSCLSLSQGLRGIWQGQNRWGRECIFSLTLPFLLPLLLSLCLFSPLTISLVGNCTWRNSFCWGKTATLLPLMVLESFLGCWQIRQFAPRVLQPVCLKG